MYTYLLGLDLAQQDDFTALAVLERSIAPAPGKPAVMQWQFSCRYLRRFHLGTPYPQIVKDVGDLVSKPPLRGCTLAVDATGVGAAVVDMFRAARLPVDLQPILITSGHAITCDLGVWHVPKKELVSILQVLLQSRRLAIAKALPESAVLEAELQNFKVKITAAANEVFEAWRERDHDDLVLSVALAAWIGERQPAVNPLNEMMALGNGVAVATPNGMVSASSWARRRFPQ